MVMNNLAVRGSIKDVSGDTSIAQSLEDITTIVIMDTSLSMDYADSPDGTSRHAYASIQLEQVQAKYPGQIALVSFGDCPVFCANGIPNKPHGTTDMVLALQYVKVADDIPDMNFILISDGDPDDEWQTLAIAEQFKNKIDTIYIGPEGGYGEQFLRRLSAATGGTFSCNILGKYLSEAILNLLEAK